MAYRVLTNKYEKIRSMIKTPLSEKKFIDDDELTEPIELVYCDPTSWRSILESVEGGISQIQKRLKSLHKLHEEHVTPRFGKDYTAEEQQIEILTQTIKDLFKECIKNISDIGGSDDEKSQEDVFRKNMKTNFVLQLNDLSKEFKDAQRNFIQKLKSMKDKKKTIGVSYENDDLDPEEKRQLEQLQDKIYTKGFTDEQMSQILQNEREILDRDRELKNILSSIIELKDMFQEFSNLVIEQGTILDRIDHNLDHTIDNVDDGTKNLVKAESYQKCSKITLCMLFVVIAVAGAGLILTLKILMKLAIL
eukprot:gene3417-5962_t